MEEPGRIATHADPVGRDRANFIIRVDLTPFGLAGSEQLWTRTDDDGRTFEVCCIPFFTYGIALGDRVTWDEHSGAFEVVGRSGHRCIRIAFLDEEAARSRHEELHGAILACGALVELNGTGYWSLDIGDDLQGQAVIRTLAPWAEDGILTWEWGDR